ncbi:N-acetylneuraminate synthase [Dyadobacter jejuensis]|uniref:N-acetylneuraminate synthase n=1 Tax=Dyadobacter jejuensis TaxID=1082580 RepID=A0A316ARS9_9BACT|nr:N-acetylneuraminate synthase family protein [Dyadobacter jejuensis]PWJ60395.1 N-acetylneuraminate synthase [Dyadobacter jejuensis]
MDNFLSQVRNIALKSGKSKIAIIGKGESVHEIILEKLNNFFIINLNDSERIIPGNVAFFYRIDFFNEIKKNGFKADFYVAPDHLKIPDDQHLEANYQPRSQDIVDQPFSYIQDTEFTLTDFTVLSAIKFLTIYQGFLNLPIEVYFLGFDFTSEKLKDDDYDMHDLEFKNAFLKTQESVFSSVLRGFNKFYPDINLIHVGNKNYSSISVTGLNKIIGEFQFDHKPRLLATNRELYQQVLKRSQESNQVIVVAEFTNNHIGDPQRLVKMIKLAKEAGADMIKLQKRDVDSFYSEKELSKPYDSPFGNTLRDYRTAVELNESLFELVDEECRRNEIPWFTSVLDWNSYEFMLQFDPPLIKLPSTISNHRNYLLKVGSHFKGDLIISTGFTDKDYENFILENFLTDRNLFILQCTSSYPTPPEACQIAVVRHYDELSQNQYSNLLPGYSSHDVGSLGCMLAVAAGAKMLEKHVKLGNLDWVHFDGVAIDLYNNEFKQFVHDVRKAELMCGNKTKKIHTMEHHKYIPHKGNN